MRSHFAQLISPISETALRFLEMGQALKAHGTFASSDTVIDGEERGLEVNFNCSDCVYLTSNYKGSYDANLLEIQLAVQELLSIVLADASSNVKRAVLHNVSPLCIFLGRQRTNDLLLSHMITYLNDRDWLLRYAFFDSIVDVAACVGGKSLEQYILPLMIQSVSGKSRTCIDAGIVKFLCRLRGKRYLKGAWCSHNLG